MINSCTIVGYMAKDPEVKVFSWGMSLTGVLAVKRDYKNKNNEYDTDFIKFKLTGKFAELMSTMLAKGQVVGVTGKYQNDKVGESYFHYIKADTCRIVTPKSQQGVKNESQASSNSTQGSGINQPYEFDKFQLGAMDIDEDDIPF